MLSVFAFDPAGSRVVDDPDEMSDLIQRDDVVVWADLLHPTDEDLAWVKRELDLHPLAIEDASKHGQRPKLEQYEGHAFIVAYASTKAPAELKEVDIFLGPNWLVTVHEKNDTEAHFDLEAVRERCSRPRSPAKTVSFLLYTVLDEIVDTYFGAVDAIAEQVDEVEELIFSDQDPEDDDRAIQQRMLHIRKEVLSFRRRVVPMREVLLTVLRDDVEWIDPNTHHYFEDILDHVMRITEEIDNQRELIGNAVDAHLALASNQMNQIMKRMTSWGAILIVATLIAGIYGMNFEYMPELHLRYGYYGALGTMVITTGGLYLYFKRKRWI